MMARRLFELFFFVSRQGLDASQATTRHVIHLPLYGQAILAKGERILALSEHSARLKHTCGCRAAVLLLSLLGVRAAMPSTHDAARDRMLNELKDGAAGAVSFCSAKNAGELTKNARLAPSVRGRRRFKFKRAHSGLRSGDGRTCKFVPAQTHWERPD
jgi:hypothetical protein